MRKQDATKDGEDDIEQEIWKVQRLMASLRNVNSETATLLTVMLPADSKVKVWEEALLQRPQNRYSEDGHQTKNLSRNHDAYDDFKDIAKEAQKQFKLVASANKNALPRNGYVMFFGNQIKNGSSQKLFYEHFEPPYPVQNVVHLLDDRFHVDELLSVIGCAESYGFVIVDGNGALLARVQGAKHQVLKQIHVDLPSKHGRGGQSANRFAALRNEKRHEYVKKVAELITHNFIVGGQRSNVQGLVLAGAAGFKHQLAKSDHLDARLKVIGIYDVAYGGESGLMQAIQKSDAELGGLRLVRERNILTKFLTNIAMDTGLCCYGADDTLAALDAGIVETLIVHDELTLNRYVFVDSHGKDRILYFTAEDLRKKPALVMDPTTQQPMHERECELLTDFLAARCRDSSAFVTVISDQSPEGQQFCLGFGGVGGLLRYKPDDQVEPAPMIELERTVTSGGGPLVPERRLAAWIETVLCNAELRHVICESSFRKYSQANEAEELTDEAAMEFATEVSQKLQLAPPSHDKLSNALQYFRRKHDGKLSLVALESLFESVLKGAKSHIAESPSTPYVDDFGFMALTTDHRPTNSTLDQVKLDLDPLFEVVGQEIVDVRPHLSIVFVGHVDAGKSTTCGNILYTAGMVSDREIVKYKEEAKENNRESWYLAYVMDSEEERVSGKTAEVGRKHFATSCRRFTILDAPGHSTYVSEMLRGAAMADVGVLIISARTNEFEAGFDRGGQTREHALLCRTLGVEHLIVAVNKMDDAEGGSWEATRYREIEEKLLLFLLGECHFLQEQVTFLPISGRSGANLKERGATASWWNGPTFFECLDGLVVPERMGAGEGGLCVPVLDSYKDDQGSQVVVGKVERGRILLGMTCKLILSGIICTVKALTSSEGSLSSAGPGECVTVALAATSAIRGGDILAEASSKLHVAKAFLVQLQVLELPKLRPVLAKGYRAMLHVHAAIEECMVSELLYRDQALDFARSGDKVMAIIQVDHPLCIAVAHDVPRLARFALRDEDQTIALGIVVEIIDRSPHAEILSQEGKSFL